MRSSAWNCFLLHERIAQLPTRRTHRPRRTLIIPAEQARGEALTDLARKRFDLDLRPIEQQVILHSCGYEDPFGWGSPEPERTSTGRPLPGWQGPELRPALLRWLLTDPEAFALLEPRGLRIWNARLVKPLDLSGCRITVRLELRYCLVEAPLLLVASDLPSLCIRNSTVLQAVQASYLKVRGPLLFEDAVFGDVLRFDAANIEAGVRMSSTALTAKGGALSLQGANIAADLQLRPEFRSSGSVLLRGLHVGGQLSLSGAELTHKATALNLEDSVIQGHLFLRDGFQSAGEIHMAGAKIGGQLDCSGARLAAEGTALDLNQAVVHGSILLHAGFEAVGPIHMRRAEIGGDLDFEAASVGVVDGESMEVKGDLLWRQLAVPERCELSLAGARIKRIQDERASWPRPGKLRINGLVVQSFAMLEGSSVDTASMMAWLNLQPESELGEPQPWMQAAAMLKAKGRTGEANRALFALHRHQSKNRWRHSNLRLLGRAWDTALARLQEQPVRIVFATALLILSGGAIHYRKHLNSALQAAPSGTAAASENQQLPATSPRRQAVLTPAAAVSEPLSSSAPTPAKLPATSTEPLAPVDVEASSTASSFAGSTSSEALHKSPAKLQKPSAHKVPLHSAKRTASAQR